MDIQKIIREEQKKRLETYLKLLDQLYKNEEEGGSAASDDEL